MTAKLVVLGDDCEAKRLVMRPVNTLGMSTNYYETVGVDIGVLKLTMGRALVMFLVWNINANVTGELLDVMISGSSFAIICADLSRPETVGFFPALLAKVIERRIEPVMTLLDRNSVIPVELMEEFAQRVSERYRLPITVFVLHDEDDAVQLYRQLAWRIIERVADVKVLSESTARVDARVRGEGWQTPATRG